jgi:hypothetical protein
MKDRYFLDIRNGCGAVIDRQHPKYDSHYPGLHSDTGGVVLYKHGYINNDEWCMSEEDIQELQDLCDKLNVWPNRDKKLKELGI